MTVPALEEIQFPIHYEYVLVGAGESKDVFYINVENSGGYTAFIERVAFDWQEGSNPPDTASVIEFIVDGVPREYRYAIDINKPYVFDPPIVARRSIRFRVTNNDVPYVIDGVQKSGAHWYGILADGRFVKPKI